MASRDLMHVHPAMRPQVCAWLAKCAAEGLGVIVVCTYRSDAEQAAEFARGRTVSSGIDVTDKRPLGRTVTSARPGQSAHNFVLNGIPAALAVDYGVIVNGRYDREGKHPHWRKAGELAQTFDLDWYGAPGAPFFEMPHVQSPLWLQLKPKPGAD